MLVPIQPKSVENGVYIRQFLQWMLAEGEDMAPAMHYAPLPQPLRSRVLASLAALKS